jgi:hypothetical protein
MTKRHDDEGGGLECHSRSGYFPRDHAFPCTLNGNSVDSSPAIPCRPVFGFISRAPEIRYGLNITINTVVPRLRCFPRFASLL